MIILVKRTYFKETYTIGALQVDGKYLCDTLEPHAINWQKEQKIMGRTAIPEGCYKITLEYSPKFRKKMPYLMDVPRFSNVMIHTGNTPNDTRGCILVGRVASPNPSQGGELVDTVKTQATPIIQPSPLGGEGGGSGSLIDSRITFSKLYKLIEAAMQRGEEVWVKVWSPREWGV